MQEEERLEDEEGRKNKAEKETFLQNLLPEGCFWMPYFCQVEVITGI